MRTSEDSDSIETSEWVESLQSVIDTSGLGRAHFLLDKLIDTARSEGAYVPPANTPYLNTIPKESEPPSAGRP